MSSLAAMGWLQSSLGLDITGEWNSLVSLNVGGCTFSCQRKTFKCCADTSILCRMALSTDRSVARTEDGSVIIDRDPETFRHVLNFLRSGQRLVLPDDFADWDLLMEDARVYELPSLGDALRAHPKYQQRCFQQSLPAGVMLRWVDAPTAAESSGCSTSGSSNSSANKTKTSSSGTTTASSTAAADDDSKKKDGGDVNTKQEQQQHRNGSTIEVFPPLQLFGVDSATGKLMYQGREVQSIDEAVSILLCTYQMHIETWHRDTIHGAAGRIAHTLFFSRKQ